MCIRDRVLDDEANETRSKENRFISSESSKVKVMVIPTNEEVMICLLYTSHCQHFQHN